MAGRYSPKIVTDGLVLLLDAGNRKSYPGTGSTWFDLSGNGYHFTLYNSPAFSSSDAQGSFTFVPASSQYASYPTFPLSFSEGSFTIGITCYYTSVSTNDGLLMCSDNNAFNTGGFGLEMRFRNGGPMLEYTVSDGVGTGIRLQASPVGGWSGRWSTIWVRHNAQATALLYDKASLVQTASYSGEVSSTNKYNLNLGVGPNSYFSGRISTFHVYNRVLSGDEILQNHAALSGRFGL